MIYRAGLMGGRRTTGTGTFSDCVNITGTQAASGFGAYTLIAKFLTPALAAAGTVCRVTVTGPTTGTIPVLAFYIGQLATSGNAYDYDGGQVALTFGGSPTRTIGTNEVVTTDTATFAITQSKAIILAMNMGTGSVAGRIAGLSANHITYYRAGAEAATSAKTAGYDVEANRIYAMFKIEVA